jgi:hypothetical protein
MMMFILFIMTFNVSLLLHVQIKASGLLHYWWQIWERKQNKGKLSESPVSTGSSNAVVRVEQLYLFQASACFTIRIKERHFHRPNILSCSSASFSLPNTEAITASRRRKNYISVTEISELIMLSKTAVHYCRSKRNQWPVTVAERPKACTVFARSEALSKGPNWVGVFSPTFTWGRQQIQFPKRRVLQNTRRWKKSKNPVILCVMHHRQHHWESIRKNISGITTESTVTWRS